MRDLDGDDLGFDLYIRKKGTPIMMDSLLFDFGMKARQEESNELQNMFDQYIYRPQKEEKDTSETKA